MSRVRAYPLETLVAVVSAILIVVGRINSSVWWGDILFLVGITLIVVAGVLVFLRAQRQ